MDLNFLCLSLSAMKQLFLPKPWSLFYWCLMYKQRHDYWYLYLTTFFVSFTQKLLKLLNYKNFYVSSSLCDLFWSYFFTLLLSIYYYKSFIVKCCSFFLSFISLSCFAWFKINSTHPKKTHPVLVTNNYRVRFIFNYKLYLVQCFYILSGTLFSLNDLQGFLTEHF